MSSTASEHANAAESREQIRRVLVMELAGLGDNVHLLPALWCVRREWPHAELHMMVNADVASLFSLTPWVDRVWPYPRGPRPGFAGNLRWARRLRDARFDVVVNTTGSDRSSLLTFATGAPLRIGRRPSDRGPPGWRALYTRVAEVPFYREPMYVQKWRFVKAAGIAACTDAPEFHATIDASLRRKAGIDAGDERRYVHLSPFTTADARELHASQVAELVDALRRARPELRIAISCANTARERAKLDALLPLLREPPWRVYRGTLDIASLASVIETCAVNLSGDTGSLHLAMMARAPAVAWFRAHKGQDEWIPIGARYRVIVADGGAPDALHGIATSALVEAVSEVLA